MCPPAAAGDVRAARAWPDDTDVPLDALLLPALDVAGQCGGPTSRTTRRTVRETGEIDAMRPGVTFEPDCVHLVRPNRANSGDCATFRERTGHRVRKGLLKGAAGVARHRFGWRRSGSRGAVASRVARWPTGCVETDRVTETDPVAPRTTGRRRDRPRGPDRSVGAVAPRSGPLPDPGPPPNSLPRPPPHTPRTDVIVRCQARRLRANV